MAATRAAGRLPGRAWLVLAGELVSCVGSGATVPYLVVYLYNVCGAGLATIGAMLTIRATLAIVGAVLGGSATDRLGARTVAVAGLAVAAVGSVLAARAGGPLAGFAAVAGCTLACASLAPALDTLLVGTVTAALRQKVFAWRNAAVNLGGAAGAALASLVVATAGTTAGLRGLYIVDGLSFAAFATLLGVALRGTATPTAGDDRPAAGGYREVLADPGLRWAGAVVVAAVAGGFALLHVGLPAYVVAVGVDVPALGWAFAANMVGVVVLQLPVQRWLPGRRRAVVLTWSLAMLAAAWILVLLAGVPGAAALAMVGLIFAVGETLFIPVVSTLVNDLATAGARGRYNGVQTVAWTGGFLVGAAGSGAIVAAGGARLLFGAGIVLLAAGGLAAVRLGRVLPTAMARIPYPGQPDPGGPDPDVEESAGRIASDPRELSPVS